MAAICFKAIADQIEMFGFFVGRFDPIVVKSDGHRDMTKTRDDVPVQIHGIQFDMRHGMQDGQPPLRAAGAAAGHVARVQQFGPVRARRLQGRRAFANGDVLPRRARREPCLCVAPRQGGLFAPIRGGQNLNRHLCQGLATQSDFTASRTSSAWPGTFTLRQTRAICPVLSIKKVERSIPQNFLPYMLFSFHTPYCSQMSLSASVKSGTPRSCLSRNFSCLATVSFEMPMTVAPAA